MAHAHASPHAGGLLAIQRVEPYEHRGIAITSDALDAEGRIGAPYSAYNDDIAPGLKWSPVLEAESYVLVVEDPDAPGDRPFLHWMLWNIPGKASEIPARISRAERPAELPGAVQGLNAAGRYGWHGTKPPHRHEEASGRGGVDPDDVDRHAPHGPDGELLHRPHEKP